MPENQSINIGMQPLEIIDIRGNSNHSNTTKELKDEIFKGLTNKTVKFQDYRVIRAGGNPEQIQINSLPTMLLYDTTGLEIFDRITYGIYFNQTRITT